ncbi:MAG TPA: homocysteine S-methyltransferase family protein [Anaerolineales bacterium]|nr:homocysteine S-methyltransferase family protein [Anaerolineales bacterium]
MNRYQALIQRLDNGEQILIDGATGTEIERRGVPMVDNAWNGMGAMTHPDIVRQVHEDYIRCGAQIIISNTFSTSRHVLQDAGFEEHFEVLNRRGIELAREARTNMGSPNVLVAGGIAYLSFTGKTPPPEQLRANLEEQAVIMADAGADLIMLEMMADIERTEIALEAAQKTGLPVWVGFSCHLDEVGEPHLLYGSALLEGVKAIQNYDVPVVTIMHTEVEYIDACLNVLKANWQGPIGVYAHLGKIVAPNWIFNDVISPEDYASAASSWLQQGVQVLGGCCGIGLEHMQVLKDILTSP